MIQDAEQIIDYASRPDGLNYPIENIILVGKSLGTGVTVQAAAKYPLLKAIILISAFTSIRDVAKIIAGSISKLVIPDIFRSIDVIHEIKSPMLFIHGVKDELIPYSHSIDLHKSCGSSKKKLELRESMDHNRVHFDKDIFFPIQKFLNEISVISENSSTQSKSENLDLDPICEDLSKLRAKSDLLIYSDSLTEDIISLASERELLMIKSCTLAKYKTTGDHIENLKMISTSAQTLGTDISLVDTI